MIRATQTPAGCLRFKQAMHRTGLWQVGSQRSDSELVDTVTVGGEIAKVRRDDAALIRRWFRNTEPSQRDRFLRSIAPYLADGDAVLHRYTMHRRRIQTVTTGAFVIMAFLAGLVIAALSESQAASSPVTSALLVAVVIAAVKLSYTVESLSTLELAASLATAQHTAEATIGGSNLDVHSHWDALVHATSDAIEHDQPIADEAIGFVEYFLYNYRFETQTPSLTPDQRQLLQRYDTTHPDPDIAAAVQQIRHQEHRRQDETWLVHQRRCAIEDEAMGLIDRINLEQDKIAAAAIRHLGQAA